MQAVNQRAMQIADQATAMAQRGMLFSARAELIKALQLLTQAADAQEGTSRHAASLAAALVALAEAREFTAEAGRPGEAVNTPAVAARHRTAVLSAEEARSTSPIVAQQRYFAFAQEQLAFAAGQSACASQILYRLGRLQTAMAAHDADPLALHGPQAMVFHQAALVADASNYLAANELGVLLARYGQLADARRLLVQSVSLRPHLAGWQNLAFVHRRLGETDLANKAEHERKLLEQQNQKTPGGDTDMVRWVDSRTFAASPGGDVHWPASTETKTAAAPTSATRR
jgi:tetratricopeptide (TPR) repeat protein